MYLLFTLGSAWETVRQGSEGDHAHHELIQKLFWTFGSKYLDWNPKDVFDAALACFLKGQRFVGQLTRPPAAIFCLRRHVVKYTKTACLWFRRKVAALRFPGARAGRGSPLRTALLWLNTQLAPPLF